ncbi:MAG: recombinase family protein [Clostridiales Family XIII bacterium]|nr:recombinase family protein [Clostridiales Family XIII bacterium]
MKGADGKYAHDPDKAPIVKQIFEDYIRDVKAKDIMADLNARGIRTGAGNRWERSSLLPVLSNEKYKGVYTFGDLRDEDGIPPIVDKGTFDMAQEKLHQHRIAPAAGRMVDYSLTGRLFCGACGSTMVGTSATSRTGETYYYYSCSGKRKKSGCEKTAVRKQWIEEFIGDVIRDELLTDKMIAKVAVAAEKAQHEEYRKSDAPDLERRLRKIDKEMSNYIDAIGQMGLNADITAKITELENDRGRVEKLLAESHDFGAIDKRMVMFYLKKVRDGMIDGADDHAIEAFVQRVELTDKDIKIICRTRENETQEFTKSLAGEDAFLRYSTLVAAGGVEPPTFRV